MLVLTKFLALICLNCNVIASYVQNEIELGWSVLNV